MVLITVIERKEISDNFTEISLVNHPQNPFVASMDDLRHPICAKSPYWVELRHFPSLGRMFPCSRETIKTLLRSEINSAKPFRELIYLLDYFGYLPAGLESLKLPRDL